ncbi:MAG TPA: hypothetical protein VML19_14250 [Verrucomicrobiae bacterium]|nr:hypothetical protein [Verrucomicrobiae bacterium]
MNILAQVILENMKDLHRDHEAAIKEGQARRARAIELAIFKCKSLTGSRPFGRSSGARRAWRWRRFIGHAAAQACCVVIGVFV